MGGENLADLGKVAITDGGDYSESASYEKLTLVHYMGNTYMTLTDVVGVTPNDDGENYRLLCGGAKATGSYVGTGDSGFRSIDTGSSGILCAIQGGAHTVLLGRWGGIYVKGSDLTGATATVINYLDAHFADGVINLETMSDAVDALNRADETYVYQVL